MFNAKHFTLLVMFSLHTGNTAYGEQISFSKQIQHQGEVPFYQFSYQWQDHLNRQQSLAFQLPQQTIFDRYRNFRRHNNNHIQQSVHRSLQKHLDKNPINGVEIQLNQKLYPKVIGNDQMKVNKAYRQIDALSQKYRYEYLQSVYYHQFTTHQNIIAIKPDHSRIAMESVADIKALKPIILEKASIKNIRKVSNYVLSFIQNIPYITLQSRITSSGASFNPPLQLLWENQGDCDSKVTLAASLLRALMPRVNLALIFMDDHALVGIDIKPQENDISIILNNITYVVAEVSGPDLMPIGKLAPNSVQAILAGHYVAEKMTYLSSP
jgi:hypothetical protein